MVERDNAGSGGGAYCVDVARAVMDAVALATWGDDKEAASGDDGSSDGWAMDSTSTK
jgi:hypothetical protein